VTILLFSALLTWIIAGATIHYARKNHGVKTTKEIVKVDLPIKSGIVKWVDPNSGFIGIDQYTFGLSEEGLNGHLKMKNIFPGDTVKFTSKYDFMCRWLGFHINRGL
jgi:hypothetical protein